MDRLTIYAIYVLYGTAIVVPWLKHDGRTMVDLPWYNNAFTMVNGQWLYDGLTMIVVLVVHLW